LLEREETGCGGAFGTTTRIGGIGDEDPVATRRIREMKIAGLVPGVEEQ
jgi:hypothetical protein